MSHRERRCLFTKLMAELVLWIYAHEGWQVNDDEGTVHSPRLAWVGLIRKMVKDAVHKRGSFHHLGLARDLNLFINGDLIEDGGHPAWEEIAAYWLAKHPDCTSGIGYGDANHFSFGER